MKTINVEINNKAYKIKVALTDEENEIGLQKISELPKNEGMLFIADSDEGMSMWMQDTVLPLDIIFIDEDWEVLEVARGEPLSEELITNDGASYVLELNTNSEVEEGDFVDLTELDELLYDEDGDEDDEDKSKKIAIMIVLDPDGESQMDLLGGERIFSRPNTKTLIRMARRADKKKTDSSYKSLGKKVFSYIKQQDEREPDYVDLPEKK